jgi:DNA polymerase
LISTGSYIEKNNVVGSDVALTLIMGIKESTNNLALAFTVISLVQLIVAVGRIAAQNLLGTDMPLAKLRGTVHALGDRRRPVLVTYHPAYLLRSPGEKRKAWQDLLLAKGIVGRLERGENVLP